MAGDGIFLKTDSGLVVLSQTPYDSEAVLQFALADYPEVLAGPTTAGGDEPRLLLIRREMSVPSQDSAGNFSLDHLFLDSEGVPVLVEVKRSSDTRIRREVVGQMLDYAANAVKYWPVTQLRQSLEDMAASSQLPSDEQLKQLRPDLDVEEFWRTVESNLRAGRIRMVFVADSLPADLVRIIEFLNEQMTPAEVLGVELRQFTGGAHTAYVPQVVGRTANAVAQKEAGRTGQQWGRESFLEAAATRCTTTEVKMVEALLKDVDDHGSKLSWGKGVTPGVGGWYEIDGQPTGTWALNLNSDSPTTRAYLTLYFSDLVGRLGPDRLERAAHILEQIPSLKPKIDLARSSAWKRYPSLYLADVAGKPEEEQALMAALTDLRAAS